MNSIRHPIALTCTIGNVPIVHNNAIGEREHDLMECISTHCNDTIAPMVQIRSIGERRNKRDIQVMCWCDTAWHSVQPRGLHDFTSTLRSSATSKHFTAAAAAQPIQRITSNRPSMTNQLSEQLARQKISGDGKNEVSRYSQRSLWSVPLLTNDHIESPRHNSRQCRR